MKIVGIDVPLLELKKCKKIKLEKSLYFLLN
ncbi:MAG: hypothetical protein ACD_7C00117G0003 [uncultured bacterium]|nr:MAG: hypothetical protein ACD_7C00117G0003 [uncultured bacterium]